MPLTPVGMAGVIVPALASVGAVGIGAPQLASGIAMGLIQWALVMKVRVVATGTAGAGTVTTPPVVPSPLLAASLVQGFASAGVIGIAAPSLALGVANGMSAALGQGVMTVPVPGVGSGAGIANLQGTAVLSMGQGFAMAGLVGTGAVQWATGIGIGMDLFFAGFTQPVPVLGPSSPTAASTVAFGQVV